VLTFRETQKNHRGTLIQSLTDSVILQSSNLVARDPKDAKKKKKKQKTKAERSIPSFSLNSLLNLKPFLLESIHEKQLSRFSWIDKLIKEEGYLCLQCSAKDYTNCKPDCTGLNFGNVGGN
jgi:hypothetical protein